MPKKTDRGNDGVAVQVEFIRKYGGPLPVGGLAQAVGEIRKIARQLHATYPQLRKFWSEVHQAVQAKEVAVPKIKMTRTGRGFAVGSFTDRYGVKCSIQKSSLATEDAIWLGCNDADPKVCVPGMSWQPVDMPDGYVANTRMHLTRKQVLALLPLLEHFVETGELPAPVKRTRKKS